MTAKIWHGATRSGKLNSYLGKIFGRLHSWSYCLPNDRRLSTDMDEQRLRRVVLLLLAGIYTILGLLWGSTYLAF